MAIKITPTLLILGLGILIFLVIHIIWYIHPTKIETVAKLKQELRNGQPTIVEFYSNL